MQSVQTSQGDRQGLPFVQCFQISKSYTHGKQVFKNANLEIRKAEFLFLLGRSGVGKTTFFRLLLGMEPLDQGHIFVAGRNLRRLHSNELSFFRQTVGMVFQDFKLMRQRTVFENVALPLEVTGREHLSIHKKVYGVLNRVRIDQKMGTLCKDLSAGEAQRVSIARALVNDPVMLLVDEPAGGQDENSLHALMDLFSVVNALGTTVIVATQDTELPSQVPGSRVVFIDQKRFMDDFFISRASQGRGSDAGNEVP